MFKCLDAIKLNQRSIEQVLHIKHLKKSNELSLVSLHILYLSQVDKFSPNLSSGSALHMSSCKIMHCWALSLMASIDLLVMPAWLATLLSRSWTIHARWHGALSWKNQARYTAAIYYWYSSSTQLRAQVNMAWGTPASICLIAKHHKPTTAGERVLQYLSGLHRLFGARK